MILVAIDVFDFLYALSIFPFSSTEEYYTRMYVCIYKNNILNVEEYTF